MGDNSYMKLMQTQAPSSSYSAERFMSCIPTNKHSRLITKQKPQKIRIIHIIPPEIIHTDKANFRNLVQSLTGRSSSAANTRIKKNPRPQISPSYQNMTCLLGFSGFSGCSPTKFNPNKRLLEVPNQEQLNLGAEYGHEMLSTVRFQQPNGLWNEDKFWERNDTKVEKDEMIVQAAVGTEWRTKDESENGFCIDGFLDLDEWLPQELKFPNLMPHVGSDWGIDLFGEF